MEASLKKILIIEDDPALRDIYQMLLQESGYQVSTAPDGEQGYKDITTGNFDLILLDIMLPKMSGLEILTKLNEESPISVENKIVILTNLDETLTIADSLSLGALKYIVKNQVTNEELVSMIKDWLPQ